MTSSIGLPIIGSMDISNLLKTLLDSGLTQAALSRAVGCSQSTISDMKNGKIGSVRPAYRIVDGLKKLAKKRGVEVEPPRLSHKAIQANKTSKALPDSVVGSGVVTNKG